MPVAANILHSQGTELWMHLMDVAAPKVALDIGAHIGDYTSILLGHGFERVHAFEPVPDFYAKLVARHGTDPRVVCVNKGISNTPGIVRDVTVLSACTIARPEQTATLDVSPGFVDHPYFDMTVTTVDRYVAATKVTIGFIKLDVDGYEFRVMRGASNILHANRPPILCELGNYVAEIGDSIHDWIEFVFSLGYTILPMDGSYLFTTWSQLEPWYPYHTTFDVIFASNETIPVIASRFKSVPAPEGIRIDRPPWHATT